ncbi:MAG: hypothetical protein ACJ77I_06790 [Chloroflexota bacterium]
MTSDPQGRCSCPARGRRLFHYTALHHAEEIMRSGGISSGGIPIPDPSGEHLERVERGWQWLTTSDDWAQPWATRKTVRCDRTEVRFVVEIPLLELHRLRRWDAVASDFGYRPEIARAFADLAGGDSSAWHVFRGTIPRSWLRGVEKRPGLGDDVAPCAAWAREVAR